jgi:hypothetical protein
MIEVEDREVMKHLNGATKAYVDGASFDVSPGDITPDDGEFKAFDREGFFYEIKGLKKEELMEALLNEAHLRYNVQCDLSRERTAFKRLKDTLNEARREENKWHTVASGLWQVVNNLMGY